MIGAGLVFIYFTNKENPSHSFSSAKSERISLIDALQYRKDFDISKPLKVTHKGISGKDTETTEPLRGFVFNADHLREILDTNRSGVKASDVIFYIGQNGEAGSDLEKHGIIRIIAIGMKDSVLLTRDIDQKRDSPSIFDKADPCPPFCGK